MKQNHCIVDFLLRSNFIIFSYIELISHNLKMIFLRDFNGYSTGKPPVPYENRLNLVSKYYYHGYIYIYMSNILIKNKISHPNK